MIINAYRWVFDQGDPRNFQSQYEKHSANTTIESALPIRYNDITDLVRRETKICEDMSLSMFVSIETAERNFLFWKEDRNYQNRAFEIFGKNIAFAILQPEDGVNSEPDAKGHFNHHHTENVDYDSRFKIVSCFTILPYLNERLFAYICP